jgi:hypothetical protein
LFLVTVAISESKIARAIIIRLPKNASCNWTEKIWGFGAAVEKIIICQPAAELVANPPSW